MSKTTRKRGLDAAYKEESNPQANKQSKIENGRKYTTRNNVPKLYCKNKDKKLLCCIVLKANLYLGKKKETDFEGTCNICQQLIKVGHVYFADRACNYDICDNCALKQLNYNLNFFKIQCSQISSNNIIWPKLKVCQKYFFVFLINLLSNYIPFFAL